MAPLPDAVAPPASPSKESQMLEIVILFVSLRLVLILLYTPVGLIKPHPDFHFYYETAQLSQQGYFPLINMWYEYGPLLACLQQAAYWLAGKIFPGGADFQAFSVVLSIFLLVFETGLLIQLHRTARHLWGTARANWIAWVYASLALPLFFLTYAHHVVSAFFTLSAARWFLAERYTRSAVALGLGIAAKFMPVVLFAPVIRFLWPRRKEIICYGVTVLAVIALVYLPFLILGGAAWVLASFRAIAHAGSYATVWALIDGNWGPGYYGPLSTRLDLAQAAHNWANPPVIPAWLRLALFAVLYGWLFFRRLPGRDPLCFIWFATLTMLIFHLWSKGWSPQYALSMFPLLLLSFPDRRGLWLVLLISLVSTSHWPMGLLGQGEIITAALILARTLVFMGISLILVRKIWQASAQPYAPTST